MTIDVLGRALAALNACLNLGTAVLLTAGLIAIRRRRVQRHLRFMIGATAASGLFLLSYVTRYLLTGTHAFAGPDGFRVVYLTVLFSHMVLAIIIVPMVVRLLFLVRARRFHAHASLARWTLPVWLYTSVTGLFVYVVLYHIYPS